MITAKEWTSKNAAAAEAEAKRFLDAVAIELEQALAMPLVVSVFVPASPEARFAAERALGLAGWEVSWMGNVEGGNGSASIRPVKQ